MLPWLKLLPHNEILAPFRTNETVGLLLLISGFIFYFAIGRPLSGGLAALLLATQPGFVLFQPVIAKRSQRRGCHSGRLCTGLFWH